MLKVKDWIQNPRAQFIPLMNTIVHGVDVITKVQRIHDNEIFKISQSEKVLRLVGEDKFIYCVAIYGFKEDLRGVDLCYWSVNPHSGDYGQEMKFITVDINDMKVGAYMNLFKQKT